MWPKSQLHAEGFTDRISAPQHTKEYLWNGSLISITVGR
jgi:hypothetical protein